MGMAPPDVSITPDGAYALVRNDGQQSLGLFSLADGKRTDIPLPGRICALCDVFDALMSERPYKRPWSLSETLAEIRAQSGRQFDPDLVEVFADVAALLSAELYPERTERVRHPDDAAPIGRRMVSDAETTVRVSS